MSRDFCNKTKAKPLSAAIQCLVTLSFITVLLISFVKGLSPWLRWGIFAFGCVLTVIQLLRLKSPLLIIDRIFANNPKKQIVLALFAFIITLDIGLCLFPYDDIRIAIADVVNPFKLTQIHKEKTLEIQLKDDGESNLDDYMAVGKAYGDKERKDYAKHCLIYFLGLIVFNGLLIATINRVMTTRAERYKKGESTYKVGNHYIIVGYGNSCVPIIKNILDRQNDSASDCFLILSSQDTGTIRRDILTQLHDLEERVIIYSGNINAKSHLERLYIGKAKEVFVIGEGTDSGRDSLNLECAKAIKEIRAEETKGDADILQVNVQFDKPTSYSTIKKVSLPETYYKDERQKETTYLRPFNFYENWARLLWGSYQLDGYQTLDRGMMVEANPNGETVMSDKHVHLVIAGFSDMGVALLLEALRIAHYPNYDETTGENKTVITIIDPKMDEMLPRFKSQYPYLSQISDIEIAFKNGHLEDKDNRELLQSLSQRDDVVLTVATCFYDPDYSLSAALCLPDELFYSMKDGQIVPNTNTQILVRQEIRTGLADLLDNKNGKYSIVKIFGTLEKGIDDELLDDNMAIYIAAKYHFKYDLPGGKDFFEEVEKDRENTLAEAARHWIDMNEDRRFANRYQVEMYKTYQTYREHLQKNPEALYQMEHLRWCAERSIAGYRDTHEQGIKCGKDDFQLHKLIVPYHDLPESEKNKDKDVLDNMDKVINLAKATQDFRIKHIAKKP